MTKTYRTYYTANGQPSNNMEDHNNINSALFAWTKNIYALPEKSGGKSVLVDITDCNDPKYDVIELPRIVYEEHIEGPYIHGDMIDDLGLDDIDNLTVDDVVGLAHRF